MILPAKGVKGGNGKGKGMVSKKERSRRRRGSAVIPGKLGTK